MGRSTMRVLAPDRLVLDPDDLHGSLTKVYAKTKTDFEDALKPFGMKSSEFEAEVNSFVSKLQLEMNRRLSDNDKEVSAAMPKAMAAPVVLYVAWWASGHFVMSVLI